MCKDNGRGRVGRAHTPQGQKGETARAHRAHKSAAAPLCELMKWEEGCYVANTTLGGGGEGGARLRL